jgi:hypothetical protein
MKKILLAALMVSLMVACAPISKQAKQELAKPVNCATAEGDLRMLQSEKASVEKMIAEGITAVVPIGAVVGIVTLREGEKFKVATDVYNKDIDKKIAEIKAQCPQ